MLVLAVLAAAVLTPALYYLSLKVWPYTRCPRCDGNGRNAGSSRKRWGTCRKCHGSGRRERLGTRFLHRD